MKFLPKSWKTFHEWVQRTSGIFLNSRRESLYLQAAMECSIYYINTNEIQNHFTLIFFGAKGAMYYVAIATVIFSHVKISCFWIKSSPGISLAFTEWIMFSGQGFELPLHMTNFVEATTILLRKKKKNFYQTKAAPPKHLANHESHSKQMSLSKEACESTGGEYWIR